MACCTAFCLRTDFGNDETCEPIVSVPERQKPTARERTIKIPLPFCFFAFTYRRTSTYVGQALRLILWTWFVFSLVATRVHCLFHSSQDPPSSIQGIRLTFHMNSSTGTTAPSVTMLIAFAHSVSSFLWNLQAHAPAPEMSEEAKLRAKYGGALPRQQNMLTRKLINKVSIARNEETVKKHLDLSTPFSPSTSIRVITMLQKLKANWPLVNLIPLRKKTVAR